MSEKETLTVNELVGEIKRITAHQKSQSVTDQIKVQRAILNDPTYIVSVYDKRHGKIGERCPREEAVKFISEATSNITGLDRKSSLELAEKYEFTKKDAIFFINMAQDMTATYLKTGRKMNIMQTEDCEASIFLKPSAAREKVVPGKDGSRLTTIPAFTKVAVKSKAPKYLTSQFKSE